MNQKRTKVIFSDSHTFEKDIFNNLNSKYQFDIDYLDVRLTAQSAHLIQNADVVCSFVTDKLDEECLSVLKSKGVRLLVLRSAGFNHVDLKAAKKNEIIVTRVPSYSPNSVAEFAVGLVLNLNRKIHRSYIRTRELNFSLDGLIGFDLNGKTVGVIGAGKIGKIFSQIMQSFGCKVLIYDPNVDPELLTYPSVQYVELMEIARKSDVISLHTPLNTKTFHLINTDFISQMKMGALVVNTGRGALIETTALIQGLKSGKIGGAALDVYEEEEEIFFHDLSNLTLNDDVLARLITFPNVLITSHQAFLTKEALTNIASTTLKNIDLFIRTGEVDPLDKVELS